VSAEWLHVGAEDVKMAGKEERSGNRFHLFLRRLPGHLRGKWYTALTLKEFLAHGANSKLDYIFGTGRHYDGIEFIGTKAPPQPLAAAAARAEVQVLQEEEEEEEGQEEEEEEEEEEVREQEASAAVAYRTRRALLDAAAQPAPPLPPAAAPAPPVRHTGWIRVGSFE